MSFINTKINPLKLSIYPSIINLFRSDVSSIFIYRFWEPSADENFTVSQVKYMLSVASLPIFISHSNEEFWPMMTGRRYSGSLKRKQRSCTEMVIKRQIVWTPSFLAGPSPSRGCGWACMCMCARVGLRAWGCKVARLTVGEGNGNPLQYSCLENPVDSRAWWAAIYGVAQSWTWLKRLSMQHASFLWAMILETKGKTFVCISHFSCVWLFVTLWTVARQARILEWVTMFFSRGSSWPSDQTGIS